MYLSFKAYLLHIIIFHFNHGSNTHASVLWLYKYY